MPPKFKAPEGVSDKGPLEEKEADLLRAAYATIAQQATEDNTKLLALEKSVTDGELLSPEAAIKVAIDAGTVFPKERYVGLQNKVQELTDSAVANKTKVDEAEQQLRAITTEKASLTDTIENLNNTIKEKDTSIAGVTAEAARSKLVINKFPHLASFEADGLLPTVEDPAALEAALAKFAERVGAIETQAKEKYGAGGTGKTPGGAGDLKPPGSAKASDLLLKEANDLMSKGQVTEYEIKYEEYQKALTAEVQPADA